MILYLSSTLTWFLHLKKITLQLKLFWVSRGYLGLRRFHKFAKATISFVMSICPSIRLSFRCPPVCELGSH